MNFHLIKSKIPVYLLLAFGLFKSLNVFGQFNYESLTNSNGLSQGYIYDILQDKDGFIWVSTKDGLNRYDGYNFKVFTHDTYNPYSISSNVILNLFEDSKGRLWIGTEDNGINVYDKSKNRFHNIVHDPGNPNSLSGNRIPGKIVELEDGRILVCDTEKSLNIITLPPDFFKEEVQPIIKHVDLPESGHAQLLFKDAHNKIWMNCNGSLYEFIPDKSAFEWRKNNVNFNEYSINADGTYWSNDKHYSYIEGVTDFPLFTKDIAQGQITVFLRDEKYRTWIGISNLGKLLVYDTRKWAKTNPLNPDDCLLFEDKGVAPMKMVKDRTGILWLGTNGYGLRKYSFESEKFNHIADGLSIRKISSYNQNDLYFTTWDSNRRMSINGSKLPVDITALQKNVQDFFISKKGEFWILNISIENPDHHIISSIDYYDPKTKISKRYSTSLDCVYGSIEPILEDRNGNIWVCGTNGKYIIIKPETGKIKQYSINTDASIPLLPNALFTALYEDATGIFWMGTEKGFVEIQLNTNGNKEPLSKWYKSNPADKNSLNYNHVSCFLDDPLDKNFLWICTKGGGLNRLEKSTGKFIHITTNEGLCNNVVYGILSDEAGNIWGSTNNGIFCLLVNKNNKIDKWEFRHFTKAAGLQSDEFNTWAYAKLPNGNLAFGGVNGINIFNPKEILLDSFNPNIYITKLLVGNKAIEPDDKSGILKESIEYTKSITLDYSQDILTLEFSALDFRAPDQNKYRYQMVGIDKDWVESGPRRNVTYSHLPSGTYVFKVQGSNSLGIWGNKIAELKIRVLPPWWKTRWAYLAYILLIGIAIRAYLYYRLEQTKMESQLDFEQKEAKRIKELDTVKTQLYTNITHEFRTPLTVILGMAQQIKNSPKEHFENGLNMIIRNGKHLLNLVNEMLDLSKLEAGKMELNLEKGDVIQFLRYIVESFHSMAESQGKHMHYLASLDAMITEYDAEKLRQIISNLLSNALKFTSEKGNIYVSISALERNNLENAKWLTIKIKDTGSGIPEEQIPHIFDRFYQVDNSNTRKAEGTGIGLALTKELVQLMKGSIEVKSPPIGAKKGTEFTVTLPMNIIDAYNDISENTIATYETPSKIVNIDPIYKAETASKIHNSSELILLVEDNADVVAYTASCIPEYKLAVGKNGQEGFDIACELIPDLIITDVMMPFVDGMEMSRRLRKDERTSHIPIIMLTAKADMESKLEGIDQGADAYLEKPFYKDELKLRIKKLLEQRKLLQSVYSKLAGLTNSNATPDVNESETIGEKTQATASEIPALENKFVKKVREEIENNLSDEAYSVEQLSKNIFLSYSQVHRKLVALTGNSPNQYIRILRLQKAKELLKTTDDSISSISLACGFSDSSYFGKVFKQEYGTTAQEYRTNNR